MIGRIPPHDLEAEKAVLSALLLDNLAIHSVLNEVKPDDFYHPSHQLIYQAMLALQDENEPVDLHTLSDHLNAAKKLDRVGGLVFLAELADYEATAANVVHHAKIVRDKAVKRNLIRVSGEITEACFEQTERAEQLLDFAESKIFELGQTEARAMFTPLDGGLHDAMDHVEALMRSSGELTGVPTGFKDLDADTGGLQPGELVDHRGAAEHGEDRARAEPRAQRRGRPPQEGGDLLARDDQALARAAPARVGGAASTSRASARATATPRTTRRSSAPRTGSRTRRSGWTTAARSRSSRSRRSAGASTPSTGSTS